MQMWDRRIVRTLEYLEVGRRNQVLLLKSWDREDADVVGLVDPQAGLLWPPCMLQPRKPRIPE
jgi:hypothetical protein